MTVSVRLFAILRERAGRDSVEIELPDGATVGDALARLAAVPGLAEPIEADSVRMAVNREYATTSAGIGPDDELALIPPISGGAGDGGSEQPAGIAEIEGARTRATGDRSTGTAGDERSPVPAADGRATGTADAERLPVPAADDRSAGTAGARRSPVPAADNLAPSTAGDERSPMPAPDDRSAGTAGAERSLVPAPSDRAASTAGGKSRPHVAGKPSANTVGAESRGRAADDLSANGAGTRTARTQAAVGAEPLSAERLSAWVGDPAAGAIVTFQGVTREVEALDYEAYREMAEARIAAILEDCAQRHSLLAAAAEHRVGRVPRGEPGVVVAVAAGHRSEAFDGAREAIDRIKAEAPIWKRELDATGAATWVEGAVAPDPEPSR